MSRKKSEQVFRTTVEFASGPVETPEFPDRKALDTFMEGVGWALARFDLDLDADEDDDFLFTVLPD